MRSGQRLRAAGTSRVVSLLVLLVALVAGVAVAAPEPGGDAALALGSVTQTSAADFAAGTATGVTVSETDFGPANGQLRLDSPLDDIFLAPPLAAQWRITRPTSGFVPVIANGTLDVQERNNTVYDLSSIESNATFAAGAVFEARAKITPGSQFVYLGFTSSTTATGQWAYFGTRGSGNTQVPVIKTSARGVVGGTVDVPTSATIGEWHVYRVVWTPTTVAFYIDDLLVDTRANVSLTLPQRAGFYKSSGSDSEFLIDWVRVTPYGGTTGTFDSTVLDAGVAGATWMQLDWTGSQPAPGGVVLATRTGETAAVDASWSAWSTVVDGAVASPAGRYAQYRTTLSTADLLASPVVDEVRLVYNRLDVAPPHVVAVSPVEGASGVLPGTAVLATFDEALAPATITNASFTVTPAGGSPVPAVVNYDAASFTAVLVPASPLAHATVHEVRLTTAITDGDGNALAADHVWTFTTSNPDLTSPTVVATTPAAGSPQVLANRRVTATFSEPLDPATVTGASFTLRTSGGALVAATVSYDAGSGTAALDPNVDLDWNTTYEARVTTAVADPAGNPLAADVVWSFHTRTTAPVSDVVTSTTGFAQGTSSGLAIAETDSGVAGGQLCLQGRLSDTFDSPTLSSVWFAANPVGYTPSIVDGVLNVQEQDPNYVGHSSIESYEVWGPGVVLEARAKFVPGSRFIDVGFDQSTNGNNQYAWFSTAGTGDIPGQEKITARVREYDHDTVAIETGATFNEWHVFKIIWTQGRVEFFVDGALVATHTDVVITNPMRAAFYKSNYSEDTPFYIDWIRVTPYTATQGTYESSVVDGGAAGVDWTDLSWLGSAPDATSVDFTTRTGETPTPDGSWSSWTGLAADGLVASPAGRYAQYRANLATTDVLVSPVIDEIQLCHGTSAETTPPTVIATAPSDGATDILPTALVTATFSEPLNAATVTSSSFTLTPQGGSPVAATVTYDAFTGTATLTPAANLAWETEYLAELTTSVTDIAGNGLAAPVTWSFTTIAEPDLAPPLVVTTVPVGGAVGVLPSALVAAGFSEPLDPATLTAASFTLTPAGGAAVPAVVTYDALAATATLTPQAALAYDTVYEARLTTAIADTAGNQLAADHVWSFTTLSLDGVAQLAPVPQEIAPIACGDAATLAFRYVPSGLTSGIRSYAVRVVATEQVTFTAADVVVATLPAGATVFHQVVQNDPNDVTVNYTILGADTDGITAEAELFTVTFHGVLDGAATVTIAAADLRDLANQSVPLVFTQTGTIPVVCDLPGAVTALTAAPGHQQVTVSWQEPTAPAPATVVVLRAHWADLAGDSAYPRYGRLEGATAPDRPATYTDALADPRWSTVATLAPGTLTWTDAVAPRGIYVYEVFCLDAAGLAGPRAADPAAATNYLLGDVAGGGNGLVSTVDVSAFAEAFATAEGDLAFDAVMDFGPTDDLSGTGLPLPDGQVGFEDLVILGLTYGMGASGAAAPAVVPVIDPVAHFAWADLGAGRYALHLVEGRGVKAVRVRATTDFATTIAVAAGELLADQSAPTFLRNAGASLDAGLTVLGHGAALSGTGELLVISGVDGPLPLEDLVLDARGADGAPLTVEVASAVTGIDTPDVVAPAAFALVGNYPNPFNPATTIRFALAEPAAVRLAIYQIDGRLVTTLVDEVRAAGEHGVVWRGQDDLGRGVASGTYFCRFEAGSYREVRKLTLMK